MASLLFAFLFPYFTWKQAAGCALLLLLFNTLILPWLDVGVSEETALSPGERVASVASRVRGFLLRLAALALPRPASDPSPGPRRPVKAPVAGHPLPLGEGENSISSRSPGDRARAGIVLYPISVLALIVLYRNHLHIAAAAWAIMALGDGMATVVGKALRGSALPWNRQKTWPGFISFAVAGTVGAYLLTRWIAPEIPPDKTLTVCAAASLLGAVVESIPIPLDDNLTVPLVVGAFMFCAFLVERSALNSNLPYLGRRIFLAIAVNLAFALLACALKAASRSGAVCGFFLGTAIYLGYGYKSFLLLFAFVLLGSVARRLCQHRYQRNQEGSFVMSSNHQEGEKCRREQIGQCLAPASHSSPALCNTTSRFLRKAEARGNRTQQNKREKEKEALVTVSEIDRRSEEKAADCAGARRGFQRAG